MVQSFPINYYIKRGSPLKNSLPLVPLYSPAVSIYVQTGLKSGAGEASHHHLRHQRGDVEGADADELNLKVRRTVAIRIARQYAG